MEFYFDRLTRAKSIVGVGLKPHEIKRFLTALNSVRLDIYDQDFVTIIGSNGTGKSRLLNIIAGVFLPEKGEKGYRYMSFVPFFFIPLFLGNSFFRQQ